jgi:hypothetical protein
MSDIEKCAAVIRGLEAKREVAAKRGRELMDERSAIALAAHTGDSKAEKRLTEVNAALALHADEVESLDAAIEAAGEKLAAAERAEADKEAKREAAELRHHVDELGEVFPWLDEKLEEAARAFVAIDRGFAQLRQSGVGPSDAQLRLGVASIIETWLHRLPQSWHNQLRDGVRFLAPGDRRSAVQYWTAIAASLNRQISSKLNDGGGAKQHATPKKSEKAA